MTALDELLHSALAHHRAGRLPEAEARYRRILALAASHADALHLLGLIRAQQGAPAAGIVWIERAVRVCPEPAEPWLNLAKAYARIGQGARALEACDQAAQRAADPRAALRHLARLSHRFGHPNVSLDAYGRLARIGALDRDERTAYADLLYVERRYGAAAEQYRRLAEDDPEQPTWRLALGNCCYNRQHLEAAAGHYQAALALQPDEARAAFNLGRTQERLHRPDAAEACYQAAVAADPDHVTAWNSLLMLQADRGRHAAATRSGRAALAAKDRLACRALVASPPGAEARAGDDLATDALRARLAAPVPPFDPQRPARNVICYSLWGDQPLYTEGAVANARLAGTLFPGWTCRIYHDATVPGRTLAALTEAGAALVAMPARGSAHEGLFWRFFAANDPAVDRFLCRDADCRLSERERDAVQAWLDSDKPFHIMRDHLFHAEPILAGMWGGVAGRLPDLRTAATAWIDPKLGHRWQDQDFLGQRIWPLIRDLALIHDRVYRFGPGACDFPTPLAGPGAMRIGDRVAPPASDGT